MRKNTLNRRSHRSSPTLHRRRQIDDNGDTDECRRRRNVNDNNNNDDDDDDGQSESVDRLDDIDLHQRLAPRAHRQPAGRANQLDVAEKLRRTRKPVFRRQRDVTVGVVREGRLPVGRLPGQHCRLHRPGASLRRSPRGRQRLLREVR